jgi:hypothetical protein
MTDPTGPAHTVAPPAEAAELVEAAPVASSSPVVAAGAADKAARRAHSAAIDLLGGKKVAGLTVNGNEVVFNTVPVIDQVVQQISQQGILGNLNIPPCRRPTTSPRPRRRSWPPSWGSPCPPTSVRSARRRRNVVRLAGLLADDAEQP